MARAKQDLSGVWPRLRLTITSRPWRGISGAFAAIGATWTLVELASYFLDDPTWLSTRWWLPAVVVVAAVGWIAAAWHPTKVGFNLATTDTHIQIWFGDLFRSPGHRVIAVNEFFDSEIGPIVASTSLHGQVIGRHFAGHEPDFDEAVSQDLDDKTPRLVPDRPRGKTNAYEIGTTARIVTNDGSHYLLVALTTTDPETHEADADVTQLWDALLQMWDTARQRANGDTISVPLIGSGLARVGLPPVALLQLLVLSLVTSTKIRKVAGDVQFVIHDDLYDELDLRIIKKTWT